MKINYKLNEDKTFKEWQIYPIDEDLPTLEIDNPKIIKVGKTKLINGEIVQPEIPKSSKATDEEMLLLKQNIFRGFRKKCFIAFDIWEKAVLRGREEDSEDIMNWYQDMLDFPESITKDMTKDDYPEIPEIIKYYLGVE